MEESVRQLKNRFSELSKRAFNRGIWTYSEFLTLAEQNVLSGMGGGELPAAFSLCGGYGGAERRIALFGSGELCGYVQEPPVACVEIAPVMQKFADRLTHRDFLGAVMSLGLRRELLGDIVVRDNAGYLFCLETQAEYIAGSLNQVKRTTVSCRVLESLPEILAQPPENREFVVASERLDALISSVYSLSRSDSRELFVQSRVFVNSAEARDGGKTLNEGDIVSVRGYGRFKYVGILRETKKGRLRVTAAVY